MPLHTSMAWIIWKSRCVIFVVGVTLFATSARGQAPTVFDPLGLPGSTLVCHSLAVDPADSAAFEFEYVEGSGAATRRISLATFDSAGAPLYLAIHAPWTNPSGENQIHTIIVQFFPEVTGGRLIVSDGATTQTSPPVNADRAISFKSKEETLTDADLARAKVLANWFWSHRCKVIGS